MWQVQEHQCRHEWHGYSQPGRYGDGEGTCEVETCIGTVEVPQGDRDCTSSVEIAAEAVGIPTAGYYYTGNLRDELSKAGWTWHPKTDPKRVGDVMYYHRGGSDGHAAMCDGRGNLGEFYLAETGGIDGAVGDQTGWESRIVPYYDPGWDGFMRFEENDDEGEDDDMAFTEEDKKKLDYIFSELSRTDDAGWGTGKGHTLFGRINAIQHQLTRTDAEGHEANKGHDFLGTLGLCYSKLCEIAKAVKGK